MRTIISVVLIFLLSITIKAQDNKIKVLNIGVFHMGQTSDANSTEYDEASKKAKREIKEVCEAIAKFKPTIVLVEQLPKYQKDLENAYNSYLKDVNADTGFYKNNEIQLLGFEIGRLAGVKQFYGIDHRLGYNYNMWDVAKREKVTKFFEMTKQLKRLEHSVVTDPKKIGLKNMLKIINSDKAYDFFINSNADILMYANSKNGFEGADEASKFYKRNIRMFANINKIQMKKNDRVLIISGVTHAAYFSKFMRRSMIYELEPITNYLN